MDGSLRLPLPSMNRRNPPTPTIFYIFVVLGFLKDLVFLYFLNVGFEFCPKLFICNNLCSCLFSFLFHCIKVSYMYHSTKSLMLLCNNMTRKHALNRVVKPFVSLICTWISAKQLLQSYKSILTILQESLKTLFPSHDYLEIIKYKKHVKK